jgi:hypothetical protein
MMTRQKQTIKLEFGNALQFRIASQSKPAFQPIDEHATLQRFENISLYANAPSFHLLRFKE